MKRWHEIFPRSGKGKQMIQIIDWIQRFGLQQKTVLDYGCGKGGTMDWIRGLYSDLQVTGWDIGTELYQQKPQQQFDGVYSIDCLEHIEQQDIPHTIEELRQISHPKTTWCHIIDLTPAKKRLPDGRNAHVTLMSATEWQQVFESAGCHIEEISQFHQPDKLFGTRTRCQILCRP